MEENRKYLYEFGPFRLDAQERLLLRNGAAVSLTPKAFELLLALLEQPGHLFEKEALMKRVWPDTFVEENNLTDNVSRLRKVLGEGENGQKFIETVPKRGYRFVAEVRKQNDVAAEPVIEEPATPPGTGERQAAATPADAPAPPFAGATVSETIAALLRDEAPPLSLDAPPALERIVHRALSKERAERYQTAQALLDDLNQLKERLLVEKFVVPPAGGTTNKRRRAALIAVAALVVATIAGLSAWRYRTGRPALTEQDTILLADFENKTGEEIFDGMLKQGLAIQLQQSPFLNLFPEAQVRHELTLMKRQANERVTAELAREICQRQNLKAFIAGELAPLGSHYVITLEATNGQSGETLARAQVEAENKEQALRALSQAATRLRERLGESLSSIQRFDRPLVEGTTDKLEAFKAFAQGAQDANGAGHPRTAIPFFQRAVELDPHFAIAHTQLAIMYLVTDRPELAADYAKKGYELRDQAGELEKFRITQWHHRIITGNLHKRIETLMLQRRTYPREFTGAHDLASAYNALGRSEEAMAEARESLRLNPRFSLAYANVVQGLFRLNRFAEARAVFAQVPQTNPDLPSWHFYQYQLAFISGDATAMQQQLSWANEKRDFNAFDWQGQTAAFAGQRRRAQELSRRAVELASRTGANTRAAQYAAEQALRDAVFGDCSQAKAAAAQAVKLARGRFSLPRAALALALCGELKEAKALADESSNRYSLDTLINELWLPAVRAALELGRGQAEQAIEQLQPATRYEAAAEFWPQYLRGQAYLQLQQGAAAAAEFQKILEHRGYAPLSPLYPLAHLGVARAAALTGDTGRSRQAYEDFLAVWKEADADLPMLTEAKREYGMIR